MATTNYIKNGSMFYCISIATTSSTYITISDSVNIAPIPPVAKTLTHEIPSVIEGPVKKRRKYISTRDRVLKYMGYKR